MPTENLGTGMLYIDGCPITNVSDFNISTDDIEYYADDAPPYISLTKDTSCTFTGTCRINRWAWYKLSGAYDIASEYCPNKRVVHLMKYGKSERVRHKNFYRAFKEIEKLLNRKGITC